MSVKQQTNGIDCGLFAIAFIQYSLKEKQYPTRVAFQNLRAHICTNTLSTKYWRASKIQYQASQEVKKRKSSLKFSVPAECFGLYQTTGSKAAMYCNYKHTNLDNDKQIMQFKISLLFIYMCKGAREITVIFVGK